MNGADRPAAGSPGETAAGSPGPLRAHLLLGSNIEPERNLPRAVALLSAAVRVLAVSGAWQSDPVGRPGQPPFLNAAVLVETGLEPDELKRSVLLPIERRLGRRRDPDDAHAPRTIDIDIVLCEGRVGQALGRPLPDPDLLRHPHAAVPVAEISPGLEHPVARLAMAEIARRLSAAGPPLRRRPDVALGPAAPNGGEPPASRK